MALKAMVRIRPKTGIRDPQGAVVARSLKSLGFSEIGEVRVGRYVEISLPGSMEPDEAARRVDEMCRRLLANPVIEEYSFTVEKEG